MNMVFDQVQTIYCRCWALRLWPQHGWVFFGSESFLQAYSGSHSCRMFSLSVLQNMDSISTQCSSSTCYTSSNWECGKQPSLTSFEFYMLKGVMASKYLINGWFSYFPLQCNDLFNFFLRYRDIPTFGRDTIRKFVHNASGMKKLAARDFEDLLQVRYDNNRLCQRY